MLHLRPARFGPGDDDAALCRSLMREYAFHLNSLVRGQHICIAGLERELDALPGPYAAPGGAVLLAWSAEHPAGCVALRPLKLTGDLPDRPAENACEMKRLWVRSEYQGQGIGLRLVEELLRLARGRGYTAMYLDTMPASMPAAWRLYSSLGFTPVERYYDPEVCDSAVRDSAMCDSQDLPPAVLPGAASDAPDPEAFRQASAIAFLRREL